MCPQVALSLNDDDDDTFNKCVTSEMPLDFIYEKESNSYRLDLYETDEQLIAKVQTGKGDPSLYAGADYLYIDGMFASTEPE